MPIKRWGRIRPILVKNGITINDASRNRKKLFKDVNGIRLRTSIRLKKNGSELIASTVDQIIDKFGKDESEFYV